MKTIRKEKKKILKLIDKAKVEEKEKKSKRDDRTRMCVCELALRELGHHSIHLSKI